MVKAKNITLNLGSGVKTDELVSQLKEKGLTSTKGRFKHTKDIEVDIPIVGKVELDIPPFFAIRKKKGWRLVNPLTEMRNIASRRGIGNAIKLRRANVEDPELKVNDDGRAVLPTLGDFSKKDQDKLLRYYNEIKAGKSNAYPFKNAPRGFPATLYKNAEKAGLTLDENTKTYKSNTKKAKAPAKARGRPKGKVVAEKVAVIAPTPLVAPAKQKTPPPSPKGSDSEDEEVDFPDLQHDVSESEEEEEPAPKIDPALERKVKEAKKSFDSNTSFHYSRIINSEYSFGDDEIKTALKWERDTIEAQKPRWEKELKEAEDQLPDAIKAIRENPKNKFDDKGRWLIEGEQENKWGNNAKIKIAIDLDTGMIKNNSPEQGKGVKDNMINNHSGEKMYYGSNVAGLGGRAGLFVSEYPKGFLPRVGKYPSSWTLYQSKWGTLQRDKWSAKYHLIEPSFYIPVLEKMLNDRNATRKEKADAYKKEREEEWEAFEKDLRSKGSGKGLFKMRGGASLSQKGQSAEARSFTKDQLRVFLNNVVHSGDLHPDPSNPVIDKTNSYKKDLEDDIHLGTAVERFSKDIMNDPKYLRPVPPEIRHELLDAPYNRLRDNEAKERQLQEDVKKYSHLIETSLFDDKHREITAEMYDRFSQPVKDRLHDNMAVGQLIEDIRNGFAGNIEPKHLFKLLPKFAKDQLKANQSARHGKGRGLNIDIDYNSDTDAGGEGDKETEQDGGCDGEGSAGSLLGKVGEMVYKRYVEPKIKLANAIAHPVDTFNKLKQIGHDVIHGRMDYPPHVQEILKKYGDEDVVDIDLHRLVLSVVYTGLLNVLTEGEFNKRVKEQPKDKLFHISMWVKLKSGTTILVEKNEVISMKVNPTKPKGQEQQPVDIKPPAGLMFAEMLERARKKFGDNKFFSYSAKDNNCGNFIEMVLEANGMASKATHDFIGQDAKGILEGFPKIRKFMNTLTDIAGRANVIMEGGELKFADKEGEKIDWEDIKWGSFTKQFEEYKRQHPNSKIDDLEHFAESILANPADFQKSTLKKARFYINVLSKKKLSHHNNIMPTQGGRMIGLARPAVLPAHIGHPALMSDQYPRIPQAFTQVHLAHPVPMGHGLYAGGGLGGGFIDDIENSVGSLFGGGIDSMRGHTTMIGGIHGRRPMPIDMKGGDIWGDIGRAFDPKKNGVAKALDPNQNGVSNAFNKTFTPQLGRDITSGLIHKALPAVISGVAGTATSALTGNPALGFAVGQTAGKYAGKEAGDALGKATGYGLGGKLKRPHLVKGSAEAKAYMASIRKKKMKGGDLPPRSRSSITDPSLL